MIKGRRARASDVAAIHELIAYYADQGLLLPRTKVEVRTSLGRFLVLEEEQRVVACAALEPYDGGEAEIRSLAVDPNVRSRGLGARMVQHALRVARRRKIARVFAVTHAPDFFERQGFLATTRVAVPEKIARDCRYCPRASNCDLSAVAITLRPQHAVLPVQPTVQPVSA